MTAPSGAIALRADLTATAFWWAALTLEEPLRVYHWTAVDNLVTGLQALHWSSYCRAVCEGLREGQPVERWYRYVPRGSVRRAAAWGAGVRA